MDEHRLNQMLSNLDSDLFEQELDHLMKDMDVDIDSIAEKARLKLGKEQKTMKKSRKRLVGIVAAVLAVMLGVVTAYASEISDFIQSLMNRTSVHGVISEGASFYLEEPVELEDGQRIFKVVFTDEELEIWAELIDERLPGGLAVEVAGETFGPRGSAPGPDDIILWFDAGAPTDTFTFHFDGKAYPIQLTPGEPVVDGSDIIEAVPGKVDWINLGYKKIPGGVQIL